MIRLTGYRTVKRYKQLSTMAKRNAQFKGTLAQSTDSALHLFGNPNDRRLAL